MEVRDLDDVGIDEPELADAGAASAIAGGDPEAAHADESTRAGERGGGRGYGESCRVTKKTPLQKG
jgi:hypothetical protein